MQGRWNAPDRSLRSNSRKIQKETQFVPASKITSESEKKNRRETLANKHDNHDAIVEWKMSVNI